MQPYRLTPDTPKKGERAKFEIKLQYEFLQVFFLFLKEKTRKHRTCLQATFENAVGALTLEVQCPAAAGIDATDSVSAMALTSSPGSSSSSSSDARGDAPATYTYTSHHILIHTWIMLLDGNIMAATCNLSDPTRERPDLATTYALRSMGNLPSERCLL